MSTSGTETYSLTFANLLTDALYLIGALEEGEPITGEHTSAGMRAANLMMGAWRTQGVHLWTQYEAFLFLNPNQIQYILGPSTITNYARCARGSFGYTTLDGAHIATDTTLDIVASAPGQPIPTLTNGDKIGIELTDGTRYWTTVNGVPGATTCTLTAGLSGAASDGASIVWYTTQIARPLRVSNGRVGVYNGNEVPVEFVARYTYNMQSNKTTASVPVQAYFQPFPTYALMNIWPASGDCKNVVRFTLEKQIEAITATTNEPDFPIEAGEALIWNLAWRLAPQYGSAAQAKGQAIMPAALEMLDQFEQWDNEDTAIYFQP